MRPCHCNRHPESDGNESAGKIFWGLLGRSPAPIGQVCCCLLQSSGHLLRLPDKRVEDQGYASGCRYERLNIACWLRLCHLQTQMHEVSFCRRCGGCQVGHAEVHICDFGQMPHRILRRC